MVPGPLGSKPDTGFSPRAMFVQSFKGGIKEAKAADVESTHVLPRLIYVSITRGAFVMPSRTCKNAEFRFRLILDAVYMTLMKINWFQVEI